MTEMEPQHESGRFYDMPDPDYRKAPGLSSSMIKLLLKSPMHMVSDLLFPKLQTDQMRLGTATHEFLFGHHGEPRMVIRPDDLSPYTKEGKKWKADQIAAGKIICDREEVENINGMAALLHEDDEIHAALTRCDREVSCFAELEVGDLTFPAKARIDCIPADSDSLIDIKTCSRADDLDKLAWHIINFGYHIQALHYLKMFNATRVDGEPQRDNYVLIFVETERPWGVRKITFNEEFWALAERRWAEACLLWISCNAKRCFPGYDRGITVIKPPKVIADRYVETTFD